MYRPKYKLKPKQIHIYYGGSQEFGSSEGKYYRGD